MPSGLKATLKIASVCPEKARREVAVATSQRRTVVSSDPEARVVPSGLKATLRTGPE
jgi:hypothetical protein